MGVLSMLESVTGIGSKEAVGDDVLRVKNACQPERLLDLDHLPEQTKRVCTCVCSIIL